MSSEQYLIEVFTKITASLNLFLIVASTILNPMVLIICLKSKRLRSTSTFKLLAIGSVNDFLCNIPWNQESFTNTFFDWQLPYHNLFYCRWISVFLQLSTFQYASWLLISISLDRLLSISVKKWSKYYFNGFKPFVYSAILAAVVMGINFNEVFTSGYSYIDNGTEVIICYDNPPGQYPWYSTMTQVLLYFGYIGPYGFLVIINSMIIYKATRYERNQVESITSTPNSIANARTSKRKSEMTRTVIIITLLYILTSLPNTVVAGYFYFAIMELSTGQMIMNIINIVQMSYQTFNFFILFFSNRLFSEEVKTHFFKITNGSHTVITNSHTNTIKSIKKTQNNPNAN